LLNRWFPKSCFVAATVFAGVLSLAPQLATAASRGDVIKTYGDIAEAGYADSLAAAKVLQAAINDLLKSPSDDTLKAARKAWLASRVPYQQTEVFRFGNKIVDDWEGKVNAWPLDEGLIDYVAEAYGSDNPENELYAANVIGRTSLKIAGKSVDTSNITPALLADTLQEVGGVEANVATGYHAIEFLLWGQDLNGTGPGAGKRPATDFDLKNCTGGNCDRRAAYLKAVTELLITDLTWMAAQWKPDGAARKALASAGEGGAIQIIFKGLGSLAYGELAGERIKLGLMVHDPEEEHDCFSDNTHNSHYYDTEGIRNVYLGRYKRTDGSVVSGASVSDLVKANSAEVDGRVRAALDEAHAAMTALVKRAETKEAYDQMIAQGNAEGNSVVQAVVDSLVATAKEFERAVAALKLNEIEFEGSDSLDNPEEVGAQ
jgi:putative iron-regulated protein